MAVYNITIDLTDAQNEVMKTIALDTGKTVSQIFQEFWDGHGNQIGAVKAQVDQWIEGRLKAAINGMDSAEVLSTINKSK